MTALLYVTVDPSEFPISRTGRGESHQEVHNAVSAMEVGQVIRATFQNKKDAQRIMEHFRSVVRYYEGRKVSCRLLPVIGTDGEYYLYVKRTE
jgi:hypothetical protein